MADIAKTISVIDKLVSDGVVENYALGGATAVILYTEPIATENVDIFVYLKPGGNPFIEFPPIFYYLKDKGYGMKGEHFYVEGRKPYPNTTSPKNSRPMPPVFKYERRRFGQNRRIH